MGLRTEPQDSQRRLMTIFLNCILNMRYNFSRIVDIAGQRTTDAAGQRSVPMTLWGSAAPGSGPSTMRGSPAQSSPGNGPPTPRRSASGALGDQRRSRTAEAIVRICAKTECIIFEALKSEPLLVCCPGIRAPTHVGKFNRNLE